MYLTSPFNEREPSEFHVIITSFLSPKSSGVCKGLSSLKKLEKDAKLDCFPSHGSSGSPITGMPPRPDRPP